MIMKHYKRLFFIVAVFIIYSMGLNFAQANCVNLGTNAHADVTIKAIYDDAQTPIGSTLGYAVFQPIVTAETSVSCTGGNSVSTIPTYNSGAMFDTQNHIYNTSIPGLGLQGVIEGDAYFTVDGSSKATKSTNPQETQTLHDVRKVFKLIKTGNISPIPYAVGLASIRITAVTDNSASGGLLFTGTVNLEAIKKSPCYVDTDNISIPMGTVFANTDFHGLNSTSKIVDFTIKMQCSSQTTVRAQITATQESGYDNAIQTTDAANRASGIAVQIVHDGVPFTLNSPFTFIDQSKAGENAVTWGARYIQTQQAMTAGQANAVAVVNFIYN